MFGPVAIQIRLALFAPDRGLDLGARLVVARRAGEPMDAVVLRALAYCIFYRDELGTSLRFTSAPADRDSPDLWAHDLAGRAVEWIVCGDADAEELSHVLRHQRQAAVRVLFGSDAGREDLFHHLRSLRRHIAGLGAVDFREVSADMVERLAASEVERQRWAVTLVEDHLYVDADGVVADCEVTRPRFDPEGARA